MRREPYMDLLYLFGIFGSLAIVIISIALAVK